MQLKGKTILITGAGSGIGLESIPHFLNEGMKVIICGRDSSKLLSAKNKFPSIVHINCDITKREDVNLLYQQVQSIGGIDILYNNAAAIEVYDIADESNDSYAIAKREIETNYLAIVNLNNIFLPMLNKRQQPAIINTTSAVAYMPATFIPTYSASKAALHSYTISLRHQLQLRKSKVRIFELLPPTVDTEVTKNFKAKKVSPQFVIESLIKSLKTDRVVINVGIVKILYFMTRLMPKKAFSLVNAEQ